jgi:hypothetical protein
MVLSALLALAACTQADDTGSGFRLSADQLELEATTTTTPKDPWLVEVATVKPELASIGVRRDPPPELAEELGIDPASVQTTSTSPADGAVAAVPAAGGLASAVDAGDAGGDESADPASLTPIPSSKLTWGSFATPEGWGFNNPTLIGSPMVFLVTENHGDWLKVLAPIRPNHTEGWIKAEDVTISTHTYHAEINVTTNTLKVWNSDDLIIETAVIDGKPATPTPLGRFYFNEKQQQPNPNRAYGTWIVSTNGYSDSLETFQGQVPIFAVHGTNNPGAIPSDISNGCVRIPNEVVDRIAAEVPMGTPVDVVA